MYPVTGRFLDTLRASHTMVTRGRLLTGGVFSDPLSVTAGEVTADATAAISRRCSATLVVPPGTVLPSGFTDVFSTFGPELLLERGVAYPDGTVELVPLGIFGLSDVDVSDTAEGVTIQLDGYDRSRNLQDARWEDVWQLPASTEVGAAIQTLIAARLPGQTFDFTTTIHSTPAAATFGGDAENDPLAAAQQLAQDAGCELYVDRNGTWLLRPVPDIDSTPISVRYAPGQADAQPLLSTSRRWSREDTWNAVIVTGEHTGTAAPVRAAAYDLTPGSPTYYGPLKRPYFHSSPLITTTAQAQDTADGMLAGKIGTTELVTFSGIVNPALDPGDVVAIERPEAGIDARYIVDTITTPLVPDAEQTAVCRKRKAG